MEKKRGGGGIAVMFPIFSGKNRIILIPFEWLEETTLGRGVINMKGIFAPVSVKNTPQGKWTASRAKVYILETNA